MKHRDKIIMATILAGSIGLAGLGISRAQTTETTASDVDMAITTTVANTTTESSTATTPKLTHAARHAERLAEMATKFGMTTTELQTAIESGKPMYQIAAEHGYTYAEEKADRFAKLKTRLDDMVKVGYMTQAEADALYQQAQSSPMIGMGFGWHGMMR